MRIVTLTLNPSLDKNTRVDLLRPEKKMRCEYPRFEAGGGGINVSRALKKLGKDSIAYYLAGGGEGHMIYELLDEEGIEQYMLESSLRTRQNFMVTDDTTGDQYRFGMPGPKIPEEEWQGVLEKIKQLDPLPDLLVASGSLPPGIPDDFYAKLAVFCRENNVKFIVDTSGPPLKMAVDEGVYLLKPNLRELGHLLEKETVSAMEQEEYANELIKRNKCEILVVSLGARGAMRATTEGYDYIVPPTVKQESAVGAGDSMVAGLLFGLSEDMSIGDLVRFGVAAGTAATMTPGTELCRKKDTEKIFDWLKNKKS